MRFDCHLLNNLWHSLEILFVSIIKSVWKEIQYFLLVVFLNDEIAAMKFFESNYCWVAIFYFFLNSISIQFDDGLSCMKEGSWILEFVWEKP